VHERTREFRAVDLHAEPLGRLRCVEAGVGEARGARQQHGLVVISEALHDPVAPRNEPASAQRGGAGIELGLQGGGNGAHRVFSSCLGAAPRRGSVSVSIDVKA